jgi:hypothetical protein
MSQTHIHAGKAPLKRSRLAESAAIVAALVLFGVLLAFGVYWEGCNSERESSDAKILDTRIVVTQIHEGQRGTSVGYRIEAHVSYDLHGQMQDRWVPVPEMYKDREWLEARLASHPKTCEVSWPKSHPENARCRLPWDRSRY